jgi:hypothetical protein
MCGKVRNSSRLAFLCSALGIVFAASASGVGQSKAVSLCLAYEPSVVKLSGNLTRKVYPGSPNYESTQKGDRPEAGWYLHLDKAICVDEDKADPQLNPAHTDLRIIQLVVSPELYMKYRSMVGKHVIAVGTLFGEHTAHHHTPVLLTVNKFEE